MSAEKELKNWEYFCDESYYHLWCVRRIGDNEFGQGFHLHNEQEAKGLCELLNTRSSDHKKGDGLVLDEDKIWEIMCMGLRLEKIGSKYEIINMQKVSKEISSKVGSPKKVSLEEIEKVLYKESVKGINKDGDKIASIPCGNFDVVAQSILDLLEGDKNGKNNI